MNEDIFKAIMETDFKETVLLNEVIEIINKYSFCSIKTNDKGELWYETKFNDLIFNGTNEEEVKKLRQGGCVIDDDKLKKFL